MPETASTSSPDSDALFVDWLNLQHERRRLVADAHTVLAINDGAALRMLVARVADYWRGYGAFERRIDPDACDDTAKLADARNSEPRTITSPPGHELFQLTASGGCGAPGVRCATPCSGRKPTASRPSASA